MTGQRSNFEQNRIKRMNTIDGLPADLRVLVHEYGYSVVKAFTDHGISKPRAIKHLVETVLNEFSPTRGSYARQGIKTLIDKKEPTNEKS